MDRGRGGGFQGLHDVIYDWIDEGSLHFTGTRGKKGIHDLDLFIQRRLDI